MSNYETYLDEVRQAIHLGIMCEELPDLEPKLIDKLAAWLASEGIGKVQS